MACMLCCLYLLAFPAAVTLFVHVRNKQRKWDSYPDRLKVFMLMGCFIQLAGVCGFVTYITLAITNHQGTVEQHYSATSYNAIFDITLLYQGSY